MKDPYDLYLPAPKLNQLHILRQIATNPNITQAELAERCALSVAMVNNYMKELLNRGFLEYRRKNSKCITYHLTISGREAADATQCALMQELARLFEIGKEQVRDFILSRANGDFRRVVLYGRGPLAEIALHALESAKVNILGVCSDDPAEIGREWCGRHMMDPADISYLAPDGVVIVLPQGTDYVYADLIHRCQRGIDLIRLDSWTTEPAAIEPKIVHLTLH
jgi:DNA-binding MarR family transcriptional regulator